MRIEGSRVHRKRYVQTDRFVVAVDVEMVIPVDDPSEPCLESEAVALLHHIKEHAERGDVDWLKKHGRVYVAVDEVA
jgi:hypothetical protein